MTKRGGSRASTKCNCLTCPLGTHSILDGKPILTCGDGACFLNCETCTEKPNWCKESRKVGVVNA